MKADSKEEAGFTKLMKEEHERSMLLLPRKALRHQVVRDSPELDEKTVEAVLDGFDMLRERYPLAVLQEGSLEGGKDGGQFMPFKMAPNFEITMYLAQATGSCIVTDSVFRWRELMAAAARGIQGASPLTQLQACMERAKFFLPCDILGIRTLAGLFLQVLKLCEKAGLVKLGHVALDGTKIKANASKHKAMSYERMEKRAAELEAEVAKWLSAAEAADAEEDKLYGRDKTGEEMPDWVADKKRRAEKIRTAKAELEAEAKAAAEAKAKEDAAAEEKRHVRRPQEARPESRSPSGEPDPKARKNFTDPESRIMKSKDGFVQAYNAQAAVDAEAQIAVAQDVTQDVNDKQQLVPMTDAIETNLGRKPGQLSADSGYCSDANLEALETRGIDGYIATGRAKNAAAGTAEASAAAPPADACPAAAPEPARAPTRVEAMREKIKAGWSQQPLPAPQAIARTRVRADRAGARLPPIPATGHREGAGGMGHCLHRPQPAEDGSGADSVRRAVHGPRSKAGGCLRPSVATLGVRPAG